jgi:hypothetical protein
MPSHKGEVVGVTVEAGFMAAEVFTVGLVSQVFMAGVFMVRGGSLAFMTEAFTGAVILDIFTAGISRGFMAIIVFIAMIVFSLASLDIRDGGGVIRIHIGATRTGVIRITPTILTIRRDRTTLSPTG